MLNLIGQNGVSNSGKCTQVHADGKRRTFTLYRNLVRLVMSMSLYIAHPEVLHHKNMELYTNTEIKKEV